MNTEASDGEASNAQTVRSKYFTTKSVMDESLEDFQVTKKLAGPKNAVKKLKPNKRKKAPKRIQGQKDIRRALKELESYAKDFDSVCKHAGLDVDSEQLQLAIALSTSLQPNSTTSSDNPESSRPISTRDRVGKIRTTLLEYGFKVPDIKISATGGRRLKKRKNYKLLETSLEAKKQIISEKYSQVLFENIRLTKNRLTDLDFTHIPLYYLATNAAYSILKNIDTFYVNGLLEKSTSTGSLLKDWSEIPGRPVSPRLSEPISMNNSEIECSQDELDVVLSGSLRSCKNIMRSKETDGNLSLNKISNVIMERSNSNVNYGVPIDVVNAIIETIDRNETLISKDSDVCNKEEPIKRDTYFRSFSPDIFDDEPSSVSENNTKKIFSQETRGILSSQEITFVVPDNNDVMDLTQCNPDKTLKASQSIIYNTRSQLSENTNLNDVMEITDCIEERYLDINPENKYVSTQLSKNITKRKSDDFMEITNCVLKPVNYVQTEVEIDLTESPENIVILTANETTKHTMTNVVHITDTDKNTIEKEGDIGIQRTNTKEIQAIEINNVDLTGSQEINQRNINGMKNDVSDKSFDLTQSSNTSDELTFVSLKANAKNQSGDDTIIIDSNEYEYLTSNKSKQRESRKTRHSRNNNEVHDSSQSILVDEITHVSFHDNQNYDIDINLTQNVNREEFLDLTQEVVCTPRRTLRTSQNDVSFFEEYIHNHSDNNDEITSKDKDACKDRYSKDAGSSDVDLTQSPIVETTSTHNESNAIDLTQDSNPLSKQLSQDLQANDKDVDFTEHREHCKNTDEEDAIDIEVVKTSQLYSTLGKKDDVSIDYDDLYDSLVEENSSSKQSTSFSKSATEDSVNKSKDGTICSQDSEVCVISDNELDYSMHQSKLERPGDKFLFGGISIMDELSCLGSFRKSMNENNSAEANRNGVMNKEVLDDRIETDNTRKTPVKHKRVNELATPQKPSDSRMNTVLTPSNNQYVIKTNDVTPMPNYEAMTLEEIHNELDKFGVKPFKRKRAIQLLSHIYNQTHPIVEPYSEESPCKRQKTNECESPRNFPKKLTPRKILSPKKTMKTPKKCDGNEKESTKGESKKSNEERLNMDVLQMGNQNNEVNDAPLIKEVECRPDDWVFQKREKAKVHSCRVPLHIAFHNYVSSRPRLREAILCYEPINIDDIHKDLVAYGHRYDPKDLLKFMDKKCITVKTTDNDARNHIR